MGGKAHSKKQVRERLGQRFISNQGCEFIIVEYNNYRDLWVEFQDEHKARIHTEYRCCLNGCIKNPYHPSICGIGYLGEEVKGSVNRKNTREYCLWSSMIVRCYNKNSQETTYENVTVCERWLCFANFLEDLPLIENYELWLNNPNKRISLDKDLKQIGVKNKIYSLETVKFVTNKDNSKEAIERARCIGKYEHIKIKTVCVETGQVFDSIKDACRWAGIKSGICECCKGRKKTAGGYHWMYYTDYLLDINNKNEQLLVA